ncbi:MAG: DNA recombination protein RmuC, partial [Pseudomonadota bacterium]|nr:DNA recombination protein RmuC [Pseudomonadota bacterium]
MQNDVDDLSRLFSQLAGQHVLTLGGRAITLGEALLAMAAVLALLLFAWLALAWRAGQRRAAEAAVAAERAHEAETRMAELIATQNALAGRMQTMSEIFSSRQGDMMRLVDERLNNMSGRLGQSITETTKSTQESLARLQERLAV